MDTLNDCITHLHPSSAPAALLTCNPPTTLHAQVSAPLLYHIPLNPSNTDHPLLHHVPQAQLQFPALLYCSVPRVGDEAAIGDKRGEPRDPCSLEKVSAVPREAMSVWRFRLFLPG